MKKQRDFKGVWIPKEIYLNNKLSWTEKILLIEIDSLDNEDGCFASNAYFADFIGISENKVSIKITKLEKLGLIKRIGFNGRFRLIKSMLNYTSENYGVKADFTKRVRQTYPKGKGRPTQKVNHNNIENNIDNNIVYSIAETSSAEHSKDIQEVLEIFYEINPTLNFGNKTQRKTALELVKKFGKEKLLNTIRFSNSIQGKRYSPVITTPLELKNNLAKLMIYYKKEKEPQKNSVPEINF